jgi:hypothetical protein
VAQEKTSTLYREVKPPETLTPFEHDKTTFRNGLLVKLGAEDCFVKIDAGLIRLPLAELPEPQRERYWTKPQAELAKIRTAQQAAEEAARAKADAEMRQAAADQLVKEVSEHSTAIANQKIEAEAQERAKTWGAIWTAIWITLGLVAAGLIYFAPTINARHKRNYAAILALNFFLGWTFVGWVVALAWSACEDPNER